MAISYTFPNKEVFKQKYFQITGLDSNQIEHTWPTVSKLVSDKTVSDYSFVSFCAFKDYVEYLSIDNPPIGFFLEYLRETIIEEISNFLSKIAVKNQI